MDWLLRRQPQIETALAKRHLREGTLALYCTFRTLFRPSEGILEELPAETGGGAVYRLFHALQAIAATPFSPSSQLPARCEAHV